MTRAALPFGRYLLLELLAEGGMAQVYRAVLRDASGFEKEVALKRVRRELGADPDFITRFIDEARIASTLSHGNIAQVFDFGQVDGEHFLAMELVDGPDLGTLMAACSAQRQPIPIPTCTYVMAAVARGLGAAHRRSPSPVVHRDVSPQNVLISRTGEVKVVDFGIALAAEKALRTSTGLVLGKCRYMAPEQARGEALDPRADVFAVGCVLYELLAGAPLFDGASTEQVLRQVLTAPIPSASTRNPEVPPELDEILARALSRDRDARPADASVLARELDALLHHMAPDFSSEDLSALVRATVPPRRRPAWQAAATVPETNDPALLDTERGVPAARPEAAGPEAAGPEAAGPEAAAGEPPAETPPPVAASWEPASVLVAATGAGLPATTPSPPRRRARGLLLLAAAVLLGATLGFATARPDTARLGAGAAVEHGGTTLHLVGVERGGGTLVVRLRVSSERWSAEDPSLAGPRLRLGRRYVRPVLCASRRQGRGREWSLGFPVDPAERVAPATVELRIPGAAPLELTLVEPGR